ncbi:hypothetical protein C0991_002184 [Blastosporella zonata]|nr:hypothetical protein C0991_002184 [Blastosporella zonata]
MSARVPFIPLACPPSHVNPQQEAQKAADTQFSLDLSNPLNTPAASKTHIDLTSEPETSAAMALSNSGGENRPLNTGSLMKRKNPMQQPSNRRPFQLLEKSTTRPRTTDPRAAAHQEPTRRNSSNIVAPVPRQAPRPSSPSLSTSQASGVFATNAPQPMFRIPNLLAVTPNDNQPKNDAHTSIGFSFSKPRAAIESQKGQQLPSPPDSLRTRSGTRMFGTDTDVPPPPLTLNLSGSNQPGPQRVLLNPDGTRGPLVDQNDDVQLTLNRTNSSLLKRSRPDHDVDSELQDKSSDYKRYRAQEDGFDQRAQSVTSHLSSPGNLSVRSRHRSHTPDHDHRSVYEHHNQPPSPVLDGNSGFRAQSFYHQPDAGHLVVDTPGGLDNILGQGVNAYAEEHMEQYERARERWKDCTMEEWIAGANEQAARYSKILDFVKDHMMSKMKLFASLDAKVDGHNQVLSEREKALEGVKARLVQESAHVLGHAR